ncbi:MAG: hypothetical protein ABSF55_03835 [Candidatus Staskawiczbacteria bacterium]
MNRIEKTILICASVIFIVLFLVATSSAGKAVQSSQVFAEKPLPLRPGTIFISKAFQLDSNKNILADIYDQVKAQDKNYATVPSGNYIRATFSSILNNKNDNTIYARPNSIGQSSKIEVYPVYTDANGNVTEGPLVATFPAIDHEGTYKVLLTNLQTPTDTFDFKITGNSVQFDYIVDPECTGQPDYTSCSIGVCCDESCVDTTSDTSNCGSCSNYCFGTTPDCYNSGCYDLSDDDSNCGSIGNACGGASPDCIGGSCSCDGNSCSGTTPYCSSGTCYDLYNDNSNCGTFGNVCSGANPSCYEGSCVCGTSTCSGTEPYCNSGTCYDLYNDSSNCGSYGNVCSGANPSCYEGSCVCGTSYCSGTEPYCDSGNCYDLYNDNSNCGTLLL